LFENRHLTLFFSLVPLPGAGWISRLDTPPFVDDKGITWSSAYAAILQDDPLAQPCRNLNAYINSIFLPYSLTQFLAERVTSNASTLHYILCYLRNLLAGILVYYGTAGAFHYFIYVHSSSVKRFENRKRPTWSTIRHQIILSQKSMFFYVMLPVVDEWLFETFPTPLYYTVQEIGGIVPYTVLLVLYMALVEVGIYWMHRILHTNKFLYKHVHLPHHEYKAPDTLTPWASIAFHPLDGILQACPYVLVALMVPVHYVTHLLLLFFTAIWATYIHDALDWNMMDGFLMGSKYHTVHHTHYVYNYGQWFTVCDRLWGTYRPPTGPTGVNVRYQKKQL